MRSTIVSGLLAGALALSGCATIDASQKGEPVGPAIVQDASFTCDIEAAINPALAFQELLDAVARGCDQLERLQSAGILPSVPAAQHNADCVLLLASTAKDTVGVQRLCGDPLVTRTRQSMTVYENAAAGLIPGYRPFARRIVFDQPRTDSEACGEQSISGISMCGKEVYYKPAQLQTYSDPEAAADYAVCHEEGHRIQGQIDEQGNLVPFHRSLLRDYGTNGAFRELQGDCACGAMDATFNPTQQEIDEFTDLMLSIGDLPTHGTGEQRVEFYLTGLNEGLEVCLAKQPE